MCVFDGNFQVLHKRAFQGRLRLTWNSLSSIFCNVCSMKNRDGADEVQYLCSRSLENHHSQLGGGGEGGERGFFQLKFFFFYIYCVLPTNGEVRCTDKKQGEVEVCERR